MRSGLLSTVVAVACRTHRSGLFAAAVLSSGLVPHAMAQETVYPASQTQQMSKGDSGRIPFYSRNGQDQEPSAPLFVAQPAQPGSPQPYQRTSTQTPVKNYYQELFANEQAPAKPVTSQATAAAGTKPQTAIQQVSQEQPAEIPMMKVEQIPTTMPESKMVIRTTGYQTTAQTDDAESQIIPASAHSAPVPATDLPEWARNLGAPQTAAVQKPVTIDAAAAVPTEPAPMAVQSEPQVELKTISAAAPVLDQISRPQAASGPQTPSVKVEWAAGYDINIGQECECELVVSNASRSMAYGVNVEASFPPSVRIISADPRPQVANQSLVWSLGDLQDSDTHRIKIKFIPNERGSLMATAKVHFSGAAQSAFEVCEPLLGLKIEGVQEVLIGDPAHQNVTITNPGNGIAKNVRLEAVIPAGLEHSRGERLVMDVGSLNPGESRTIRLALAAVAGGEQKIQVQASAEGGLLEKSMSSVAVIAPSLKAGIDGPGLRYKGRTATYNVSVLNDSTVTTSNVRLMHKIPEGFRFVSASRGASFDAPTRILSWFVGRLEAGKAAEMQVELTAEKIGDFTHYIRATSEHGSTTDSQLMTRVEGASSLMLEIVDLDDPVEVGRETAYEIRIQNNGSAAARDVGLSCELPEGVRFVKAEGPSQYAVEGNLILFQPIKEIAVGKSDKYRIHVVGSVDGNLLFRARMSSASSPEALTFEEMTRFYGDQQ